MEEANDSNKKFCIWLKYLFRWFMQFMTWGAIIFLILRKYGNNSNSWDIIIFLSIYFLYLYIFFKRKIFYYQSNKFTIKEFFKYMQKLFFTPGEITFIVESEGRICYSEIKEVYPYFSWRDTSGTLILNLMNGQVNKEKKKSIKLKLSKRFYFADEMTEFDYDLNKNIFLTKCRENGVCKFLRSKLSIKNYKKYMIVYSEGNKPLLGIFWYLFFNFFTLGQFYDLYFENSIVKEKFNISKTISARNDLNNPPLSEFYINSIPKIISNHEYVIFDALPQPISQSPSFNQSESLSDKMKKSSHASNLDISSPNFLLLNTNKKINNYINSFNFKETGLNNRNKYTSSVGIEKVPELKLANESSKDLKSVKSDKISQINKKRVNFINSNFLNSITVRVHKKNTNI